MTKSTGLKAELPYKGFTITIYTDYSNHGPIHSSSNNIGEPYLEEKTFRNYNQALQYEMKNIDTYVKENGNEN